MITIDPTVNNLSLKLNETFVELIRVNVPPGTGISEADVYFLADTTGSMGSFINAVQTGATNILNTLNAQPVDYQFGVGNYKDFPNDPYAFQPQQVVTSDTVAVTNAINAWAASGGGDTPEGQLFALDQIAEDNGGQIGWRAGAKKIIVWFGDVPGHDPVCQAISGLAYDITEASATQKLVDNDITVIAISTATPGLDGNPQSGAGDYNPPCAIGGAAGQGTRIANATGGTYNTVLDPGVIAQQIIDEVTSSVNTISNLKLVAKGATAPFVDSIAPAGGYGPLSGELEHNLVFCVNFKGIVPCAETALTFEGQICVDADGAEVAAKQVTITVPPCTPAKLYSYSVKFVCGTQEDMGDICQEGGVLPGTYATEINVYNSSFVNTAEIRKFVVPVVQDNTPIGREPNAAPPRAFDGIFLPPQHATMDDCCRIMELVGSSTAPPIPLWIGYLQLVSTVELEVTAVYTARNQTDQSLSIDVETIEGRVFDETDSTVITTPDDTTEPPVVS